MGNESFSVGGGDPFRGINFDGVGNKGESGGEEVKRGRGLRRATKIFSNLFQRRSRAKSKPPVPVSPRGQENVRAAPKPPNPGLKPGRGSVLSEGKVHTVPKKETPRVPPRTYYHVDKGRLEKNLEVCLGKEKEFTINLIDAEKKLKSAKESTGDSGGTDVKLNEAEKMFKDLKSQRSELRSEIKELRQRRETAIRQLDREPGSIEAKTPVVKNQIKQVKKAREQFSKVIESPPKDEAKAKKLYATAEETLNKEEKKLNELDPMGSVRLALIEKNGLKNEKKLDALRNLAGSIARGADTPEVAEKRLEKVGKAIENHMESMDWGDLSRLQGDKLISTLRTKNLKDHEVRALANDFSYALAGKTAQLNWDSTVKQRDDGSYKTNFSEGEKSITKLLAEPFNDQVNAMIGLILHGDNTEVKGKKSLNERAQVIKNLRKIQGELVRSGDFTSASVLNAALQKGPVNRLRKTKKKLSVGSEGAMSLNSEIYDMGNNFKALKDQMKVHEGPVFSPSDFTTKGLTFAVDGNVLVSSQEKVIREMLSVKKTEQNCLKVAFPNSVDQKPLTGLTFGQGIFHNLAKQYEGDDGEDRAYDRSEELEPRKR